MFHISLAEIWIMQDALMPNLFIMVGTLFLASIMDLKYRKIPIYTWIPAIIVIITSLFFYYSALPFDTALPELLWSGFFAFIGLAFVALRFYGGADGIAVMLIAFAFPVNPLTDRMQFIVLHVFVIACAIVIVWSLMNLWKNLNAGRSGNMEQMVFALPVPPDRFHAVKGWIYGMDRLEKGKLYTDSLTEEDMAMFKDKPEVWVVLAMPFMIPLFTGLLIAIFLA